jgi:NitT/TauT family transport system permease protein
MDAVTTKNKIETKAHEPGALRMAKPRSFWERNEHALLGTIAMSAFLLFWEASVAFEWVNPLFTSSPSRILETGYGMFADGSIWPHLRVSGFEFVVGFGMAIVLGVPLGILMGWYRRLNAVLDPFVSALYATPRIALLPLIMIWFGIGLESKIAIVFLGSVFPILVNTITGVRTINADFVKVARSFGASDRQLFMTVALPSSVPLLLSGLRLGLGHALIGIVVGEMYGAHYGIGHLIATSGARFQTDAVMVGIIIIAGAGVAMTELLRLVEKRFERWLPNVGG